MSLKLRDLIRQVRACKTAGEERAVIAKESAMIRTAIREEQEQYRHRNVAKLLFMHMLGYPTHFGQLECLKLIASPHFPEKRIGYLGMMLLLSEEADVLMLATNSLKNDLNSDNKFIAGLALCTIGNLATSDMSRDLATEVDKHLKAGTPYLRKKACLAMCRCLVKCPEMIEDFAERLSTLLKDRSHGVLNTVVQLVTQVVVLDNEMNPVERGGTPSTVRAAFLDLVPSLVKLLRNLLNRSSSPELDVNGISDPFLQVQILTLLRLLGANDTKASEEMGDVLAQVATNTDSSKNAGNAILYECVQTIMAIDSEESLRVLAVNILGRFLLNRDNNIRYVALNTLSKCVKEEEQEDNNANSASSTLQRHRNTIVECLKDPDNSIRQRALELIYHLVNRENVRTLTAELLNYLVLCPREHRRDICTRVLRVVEKYSPDDRWRIDTLVTMLTIAGRECDRDVQNAAAIYISVSSEDLRAYAVHKLVTAIRDDDGTQRGLLVVGIWCIGEYGESLLNPYTYSPSGEDSPSSDMTETPETITFMAMEASTIVTTIEDVTKRHSCPEEVRLRALTCFAKLCERFADIADSETMEKLKQLVTKYQGSASLELQLRSCEFGTLVKAAKGDVGNGGSMLDLGGNDTSVISSAAKEALARMPAVDPSVMQRKKKFGAENAFAGETMKDMTINTTTAPTKTKTTEPNLLDLEDIFGGGNEPSKPPAPTEDKQNGAKVVEVAAAAPPPPSSDLDLLADIFSAPTPSVPATTPAPAAPGYDPFTSLNQPETTLTTADLFAPSAPVAVAPKTGISSMLSTPAQKPTPEIASVFAFSKDGLEIVFECSKPEINDPRKSELVAKFKNTSDDAIYGVNLQCAVPKFVSMEMLPPTSTTIPISGVIGAKEVTQTVKVNNSMLGTKNLMIKLKISFTLKGEKKEHMVTCNAFPAGKY